MGLLCNPPCNDDEEDCRVGMVVGCGLGYRGSFPLLGVWLTSSPPVASPMVLSSNISVIASAHQRMRSRDAKDGSTSIPIGLLSPMLLLVLNDPCRREKEEAEEDAESLMVAISTLYARSAK